ncbi:MAG TPA: AMP-binding protein, partial [Ktedonobacteraceae bacterium]|nr:AMP-binding protein [Ktedonobacteraceae bacterium]
MENKVARFDLTLLLGESEQGLGGSLEYNSCLFDDISIEQMMENYQVLLEALVADPEQRVWDLPLHSAQPEPVRSDGDALSGFGSQVEGKSQTQFDLYERFELQVRRTPLSPALVCGSEQLSYQELHERASLLAEKLHEQGVGSGTPVGLALERSLDQIVGLLAVLKGGGIVVPLVEEELRDALIDEACVRIALTRKDEAKFFRQRGLLCLCLEKGADFSHTLQALLPASEGAPSPFEQPASEGQSSRAFAFLPRLVDPSTEGPVGAYQAYEQVGTFLDHALQQGWGSRITAGSVWSLLSSTHFIYELFLPLLAGGMAYLVPEERRLEGVAYSAWLSEQQITSAYVPALLLPALLRSARAGHLSLLRLLLTQAQAYPEQCLVELQEHLPEVLICNGYGSSDTGMWRTLYTLRPLSEPHRVTPVGRPYGSDQVLLLDTFLHPVPRGVIGELYIKQAEADLRDNTDSKARSSPAHTFDLEGGRLSRTGAYARLLLDGNLELIGLKEHSLDVQGLRVWPAESTALLAAQP